MPERPGGGVVLLRRADAFVYGKGLCFGMAAGSLLTLGTDSPRRPLADVPLTPDLLAVLREYQLRQFFPRTVFATIRDWVRSGGGRPGRVLGRLRLAGSSPDPHILCFGPAPNRRFLYCFARAHAVVPYRVGEGRVYVYDPNHPRDRGRFVEFRKGTDGGVEFEYDGVRSREGWGITLVPVRACTRQAYLRTFRSLPHHRLISRILGAQAVGTS